MSWINNLRISIKVSAVFAAICLVVAGSTAAIYNSLSVMNSTAKMTVHTYQVLEQLSELVGAMVNQETGVRGYLVSGDAGFLAPYEAGLKQFQTAAAKVGSLTSDNATQQKRLEQVKALANDWATNVAQREIALMKDPATQAKARELEASGAGKKSMDGLRAVVQEMDREERSLLSVRAAASDAASSSATMAMLIGGLVTLLLSLVGAFGVAFAVTRPIQRITTEMGVLANGDTSVIVSGIERKDEIGEMAQAVQVFKTNAIEVERLKAEQAETERRNAEQRKRDMVRLADDFESAVGQIIGTVSSASTQLEASATTLTGTAERSQKLATTVAGASEEASTNVQSVASATEEMASSVGEISRQVQESARMAGDAVGQARATTERVSELSKAAARIGDVVELINTIAGQTNLLALNATIEAARAGEAGRGFAVVASEVKALAEQTAKATGEIGQQISGIQAATNDSVGAIKEISSTIERLSEISSAIAAAVEEQGAATQEIARNVQQAAHGTQQVSSNITDVQRGATETGTASSQVLSAAQMLSNDSSRLKSEVSKFLTNVRAA
ncbi:MULTISPECIES: CHASE3 domain-containing protein [unclassified Bradyrhizobium]|uniref:methyl-accepting chemotaxis protein n=1 Tax=Bradyrhizobium TaxID=374 RepID=UPI001CD36DF1|nr:MULTISPECIES: CHASE3 domain-containing protein [unclassified Bradyrhizobium]MCA1374303.1 CHASE3 domain-containing protein [Bradyrhizobium sp. IC4060]MCA1391097.1 CHASE3 domain-containing protein [Bradyrhizobium sp. IC3123]MCA1488731.1 CHASE3 domain-containing protein [Bradyrhizobium sp. IC4061]MCA1544547.1 CHASE3 domain-containing protein [Bradyrhizobium sp. NBAIM32]